MPRMDMPREIREIVVLYADGPMLVHKGKRRRRKVSKPLRAMSKYQRTSARAQLATAARFVDLQRRAEEKKRNGWLKGQTKNQLKANRRGARVWRRAYE